MTEQSGSGRITANDVARLAGVSRSAVSRAFTPGAYVSRDTRAKVERAADLLGYRPDMLARSLTTSRTFLVGVITTHLDNPFYATLLQRLIEEIQRAGMAAVTFIADETSNDERISQLLSYRVDALVLTNTSLSSKMSVRCARGDTPVIAINRYLEVDNIVSVTCDNELASAAIGKLFVKKGRRRIAYMAGEPDTSSSRDRERGFRAGLSELGATLHSSAVGNYSHDGGVRAARELLSSSVRPDAIFCANDLMALATVDVARKDFGLDVPGDLMVAGFDNSDAAAWATYRLTSVDQNIPGMVRSAVEEIEAAVVERGRMRRRVLIPPTLVERESTGGPKSIDEPKYGS
ncbi:LacI family DNA-binding transcriptional regulator [Arsenicitalea aurantiaca]|uniref:LacI family DNA-binding transcriptional regulator n=1 Tax=Arsenicitalea aurantiaca TaxID=1783274 RepID=A0A433XEE5_9HYPH|nr:LacI family DNA-binding transcriptional regulator [Arsenicitalea aurantiaca]RUT32436.1 LacI family DNA-binding transcriptional regulator [Arsenicitalea aurantiaca]